MSFSALSTHPKTHQQKKKVEDNQVFGEAANPLFTTEANDDDFSGFQRQRKNKKNKKKSVQDDSEFEEVVAVAPIAPIRERKERKENNNSNNNSSNINNKEKREKKDNKDKDNNTDKTKKPRKQKEEGDATQNGEDSAKAAERKERKEKREKKEQEDRRPLESGRALVKAVPSGDTVVLQVLNTGVEPKRADITLSLSSLAAPRIVRPEQAKKEVAVPAAKAEDATDAAKTEEVAAVAVAVAAKAEEAKKADNKPKKADEEPAFIWQSRDFLREMVIGKIVNYVIQYKTKNNRDFGVIFLGDNNVCMEIAANGWAQVLKPANGREPQGDLAEMIQLSQQAEKLGLGIFQKDESARKASVRNFVEKYDIFAVYERFRAKQAKEGKPSKAFVEQVASGSLIRLWFSEDIKSKSVYYNVLVRVAGIECPFKNKDAKKEAFADEAKEFTEERILHRVVDVFFQGIDNSKTIQVKVLYGEQSISEELVAEGLAKVNEAHQSVDLPILKNIQAEAQEARLRIWESYVAPVATRQLTKSTDQEFIAKVREVMSGTTLIVSDASNSGAKKQINFSSLTPFKFDEKEEQLKEHIRRVGREALRSLVGKKVRVVLDYSREVPVGNGKTETRPFYSVYHDSENVSKAVVEKGLAQVVSHRRDEKRSPIYDQLLIAEKNAQKREEGRYTKNLPAFRAVDLTPPPPTKSHKEQQDIIKKAKQYLPFLTTNPGERLPCVIERVANPTKFKIFIPKESCYISFMLQGLKAPMVKNDKKSEPFAEEALEFARDKCSQRDGEVTIEEQDKFGNFAGTLFVNKQNFSVALLRAGYASLRSGSGNLTFYPEFIQAEDAAKRQNKKIWADWDEVEEEEKLRMQEEQEKAYRASATRTKKRRAINVIVTEISDAAHFYVQIKGDDAAKLEALTQQIQEAEKTVPAAWKPKSKDNVLAKSEDGKWYRAKIREIFRSENEADWKYNAHFFDFGKTEKLSVGDLSPIDQKFLALAPQARECVIASISVPKTHQEFGQEAADYFHELVWGKTLLASVEDRENDGKLHLSLGDTETNTHITAALLNAGFARINHKSIKTLPKTTARLEEEELKAKRDHLNLWRFGDISDDEEEDNNNKKGGRRGRKF
eukprot:TRINITY_DN278_c0_g1_i1.p1 TRINITY_DN278_c0_g1~~TRINITY_DN278_c0_g1_i1.p1  ORF type:complete len:1121 (+),score=714.26 TRINITY_DN278_c0_g1_i1:108-3470(+)